MTQALLNNLNIQADNKFEFKDKFVKDNVEDFSKIFNLKNENSTKTNNSNSDKDVSKDNYIVKLTIADVKNENKPEIETLKNAIEDSVNISEAFKAVDITLVQEEIENTEELTVFDTKDDSENQNCENIPTTQNETITEDTTMRNDEMLLNQPLENPATAIMLQSQLHKHSFKEQENSESDQNENENTNVKSKEVNKTLKNYDTIQKTEKDSLMAAISEKENSVNKAEGKRLKDIVEEKVVEDLNIETLEAECSNSETGSENLMSNQSPMEQAVKAMMHVEGGSKIEIVSSTQNNKTVHETNTNRIFEQISKQIENLSNGSKVNIVMNPESLGRVSLQIVNLKEGLSAQFTVATQDAQNIIMKGLEGLKETLLAHGINVDSVVVKLQDSADSEYQSDWTEQDGSNGGNKQQNTKHQKQDEKQFEQMMFEFEENGNV